MPGVTRVTAWRVILITPDRASNDWPSGPPAPSMERVGRSGSHPAAPQQNTNHSMEVQS